MKQKAKLWLLVAGLISLMSCNKVEGKNDSDSSSFAKGADISWLPQMEKSGYIFYNDNGVKEDCIQILKDHGINSVRLRTWVDPSDNPHSGHCSKDETVAMAVRAQKAGMRIMFNFHYSDTWADAAHLTKR